MTFSELIFFFAIINNNLDIETRNLFFTKLFCLEIYWFLSAFWLISYDFFVCIDDDFNVMFKPPDDFDALSQKEPREFGIHRQNRQFHETNSQTIAKLFNFMLFHRKHNSKKKKSKLTTSTIQSVKTTGFKTLEEILNNDKMIHANLG